MGNEIYLDNFSVLRELFLREIYTSRMKFILHFGIEFCGCLQKSPMENLGYGEIHFVRQ